MKTLLLSSVMVVATLALHSQDIQQDAITKNILVSRKASQKYENSTDADWLASAEKNISAEEYFFKKKFPASNLFFCAANRQQQLGFDISPLGYSAYPVQLTDKPLINNWREQVSFHSIQKGSHLVSAKSAFTVEEGNSSMAFHYKHFSIEYVNDEDGLRQNFIVEHKPAGPGNLQLRLNISGSLSAEVKNNQLQFQNEYGVAMMYYRDLKVWDAEHKSLTATMSLSGDNQLLIVVNDRNAKYPVTIDPINQTPEWSGSAAGILPALVGQLSVDAAYGFSVAGIGDINGDGYDDVAIGAPAMVDLISGAGSLAAVGAVFIYYGSANGLSATAGAMLQPNTAVAGALFGFSVAGGDINNDGKSDIIVGAPMDNVSIAIGGNTASGSVGKVYVFSGATLSTNTTPFLSLQLSGAGILENNVNLSVNALFGFSVAVTEDMNADGKKDIIVGAPAYAGVKTGLFGNSLLDVKSGGAFLFLSNATDNVHSMVKLNPAKTDILSLGLLQANINGLLFGYSVDGLGDYNGDGKPDVVVTAPAGIDLSSLGALLNGKILQGSAVVYYGTGAGVNPNPGATLAASSGGLLTNLTGTLGNIANLFGVSVKGVRDASGARNGNILVGAPLGGLLTNVLGLQLKAGTVSVFKKKGSSPAGYVSPDQVINSPRNSNNILQVIQCNLLFGFSIDNTLDVNCDGYADIIVGEPASSGAQLVNANIAGGAAYVYLGRPDGTYNATPVWTMTATTDAFLGINAASLIGYSVAGAGHSKGLANPARVLVGTPARSLDFGTGLLNLGSTFGTLFGLAGGSNGVGKAYAFDTRSCYQGGPLAVNLVPLTAVYRNGTAELSWKTLQEDNSNYFEIEHSDDGIDFKGIGKVTAAGFSTSELDYNFPDSKALVGNNYYRLKLVASDGTYKFSNTVLLKIAIKGTNIDRIYPTPFVDEINVEVSSEINNLIAIRIIDVTGKTMSSETYKVNQGKDNIAITGLGGIAKGSYLIQLRCGSKLTTQKLVKE